MITGNVPPEPRRQSSGADLREDFRYLLSTENIVLTRSLSGIITCLGYVLVRPGVGAVVLYRVSRALMASHLAPLAYAVARLNQVVNGIEIPPTVAIGPGLVIQHPSGIVLHGQVTVGARCYLHTGVVLGVRTDTKGTTLGPPTCGDDVYVGAGAKLLGGLHIGDGAQVGANAVVLVDVPRGATAVGVPARVARARLDP
jgi:serine O-acetyltransferase